MLPALGHEYEENVLLAPGYSHEGLLEKVCIRGDDTQQEPIPMLDVADALTDVTKEQWFWDEIGYCLDHNLMQGMAEAEDGRQVFNPDNAMTRAQLVMVLYRIEEEPEVSYEEIFTDVASNAWYAAPVMWAHEAGIVNGRTETTFAPDGNVTREEIATILGRYAAYKGIELTVEGDAQEVLNAAFPDAGRVGSFALEHFAALYQAEVITGMEGLLAPQSPATRAQVATMLSRFVPNVLEAEDTTA